MAANWERGVIRGPAEAQLAFCAENIEKLLRGSPPLSTPPIRQNIQGPVETEIGYATATGRFGPGENCPVAGSKYSEESSASEGKGATYPPEMRTFFSLGIHAAA